MASAFELIVDQLADPHAQWSLGTFGAIAEFMRDADEPADITRDETWMSVVTPRGGIRLLARPNLRPIAFETITTQAWSQRVAFCLPAAESAMITIAAIPICARRFRPTSSNNSAPPQTTITNSPKYGTYV